MRRLRAVIVAAGVAGCARTGLELDLPTPSCSACTDAGVPDTRIDEGCPAGATLCGSECVDLSTDARHCGACDAACEPRRECQASVCVCPSGREACGNRPAPCGPDQQTCPDSSGRLACVTTATDRDNCGDCAQACATGFECVNSRCTLVCPAGFATCIASNGDAYCSDTTLDPANCGACDAACTLPNVKTAVCTSGACTVDECAAGYVDCDSVAENGCECRAGACTNGQCGKRVFLTSELFTADLGGASGADEKCQTLADLAGLDGAYMAWLSDRSSSPSTRFTHASVPYIRVDGVIVANDWTDLTDLTLAAPIDVTEVGSAPPVGTLCFGAGAWTNTWGTGTFWADFSSCDDWTNVNGFSGFSGLFTATNWYWSLDCQGGCTGTAPLYCFEQ